MVETLPGGVCELCDQWYDEGEAELHEVVRDPKTRTPGRNAREKFPEELDNYVKFMAPREVETASFLGDDKEYPVATRYDELSVFEIVARYNRDQDRPLRSRLNGRENTIREHELPDGMHRFMFQVKPPETEVRGERRTICEHCWEVLFDD